MAGSGKRYVVEKEKIAHNICRVRQTVGDAAVYAVIKANGYGTGCENLAGVCAENGIRRFAVTERREAEAAAGFPHEEILMMTQVTDPEEIAALDRLGVTFTVASEASAEALAAYCRSRQTQLRAHVKVDTGMGRRGFRAEDIQAVQALYGRYPELDFVGIYTHFCDAADRKLTEGQYRRFQNMLAALKQAGIDPGLRHCCGSGGTFYHPEMVLDGVRVGSALLGRVVGGSKFGLQRTGICHVPIESAGVLPKGATVGYGAVYRTSRETETAVCAVGCHHGLGVSSRAGRQSGMRNIITLLWLVKNRLPQRDVPHARINGVDCPVLGCISAEAVTLDVTGAACKPGDTALFDINPLMLNDVQIEYI